MNLCGLEIQWWMFVIVMIRAVPDMIPIIIEAYFELREDKKRGK